MKKKIIKTKIKGQKLIVNDLRFVVQFGINAISVIRSLYPARCIDNCYFRFCDDDEN